MPKTISHTPTKPVPPKPSAADPDPAWAYGRLLRRFGPQGWWPVARPGQKAACYDPQWTRGRLSNAQQFEVLVGAVLTQNTSWPNAEKALESLRGRRLLSPRALSRVPRGRLEKLIHSSGYFRQKARRLKGVSRFLHAKWRGRLDLFLGRGADLARRELLNLDGVGPETADTVLLFAGAHPVFVADLYTRRFGERLGLFKRAGYEEARDYFMRRVAPSVSRYRQYHALIVALGKNHCGARRRCHGCPLVSRCKTGLAVLRKRGRRAGADVLKGPGEWRHEPL